MNFVVKSAGVFCLIFCAAAAALAEKTVTMVSNLGQQANATQGFGNVSNMVAGAFITDNTAGSLATISIPFYGAFRSIGVLGPVKVSVHGNSGGIPGSNLVTVSDTVFPTNIATYTFTNTSPLMFSTNTTYWVVLSSPGSVSNAAYTVAASIAAIAPACGAGSRSTV